MTLRHLEIFRADCQLESVTLAAEQLNMTQPAVSLAIRELESFYGTRLFERMNRRIYITDAGRTLLQYADTILSQFQESVQILQEARHSGSCRFGVHVTFGETCMPIILKRLSEELPDITAKAFVGNSRKNEEMLLRNELDFAVIDNVTLSPGLTVLPLCRERMAVVCRPFLHLGNGIFGFVHRIISYSCALWLRCLSILLIASVTGPLHPCSFNPFRQARMP